MKSKCDQKQGDCQHYISDFEIRFKITTHKQGEIYQGKKFEKHSLVFLLEGEVEFSYNEFLHRRFTQGDLFFIPQSAEMFGTAITQAKVLVLAFNNRIESLCDRYHLSNYTKQLPEIKYDFRPLRMTNILCTFVKLMESYLYTDIKCHQLHEMKQKELFLLLGSEYTERELLELFYPSIGGNVDFKSRVLESSRHGIDVAELANTLSMSYSPFLRKFKKEFGEPAKEWMLKQKAKHIILRLSIPTTTIADMVQEFGFTDLPHFIRFCHKHYGLTPKELVKSIRNKEA